MRSNGSSTECRGTQYGDRFILKGAMLFNLWAEAPYRATGDLDLLGYGDSSADRLANIFQAISETDVEPDGVEFLTATVRAEQARANDEYRGVRITLEALPMGAVRQGLPHIEGPYIPKCSETESGGNVPCVSESLFDGESPATGRYQATHRHQRPSEVSTGSA